MPEQLRSMLVAGLLLALSSTPAAAVVLTGTVRSLGAQPLFAPPSMNAPVILRTYVDDGTLVKKGDPVLSIDAGQAASQLQQLQDQIEQARNKNAKDLADLQLKQADAEIALANARAAEQTAAVDAAIPKALIAAIDYDKYQGTATSSQREAELAQRNLDDARNAVVRQRQSGDLAVRKLELQLGFFQDQVDTATVYAKQGGTVIHDFMTVAFNGQAVGRYEQGSNAMPGTRVGEIVAPGGRYAVRAWALESDRDQLKIKKKLRLHFDALPGSSVMGTVTAISGSANAKPEWGDGRYYQIDIQPDSSLDGLQLLPGMSVRIDTEIKDPAVQPMKLQQVKQGDLHASGEIYARDTIALMPPQIQGLWQLNITKMSGDGERVSKGEPIVVFAGGDIAQKLPSSQSKLKEKQRALEKLKLDLADKARDAKLATAKARADADKARRKAEQPQKYIPGIEYKKLVIDRKRAAKVLALTEKRAVVAARDRQAQMQQAQTEVTLLQHEVARLLQSMAKLTLPAPRDGILLHRSGWNGDKIDTGSQVWRGMAVGDIPDLTTIAVHASLSEHDFTRVRKGQKVSVTLSGGIGRQLDGRIHSIGRSVHSKSRAEPVPVIDLDISLDKRELDGLKPGQPVQVIIHPSAPGRQA